MIAIIGAMNTEVTLLLENMQNVTETRKSGKIYYTGNLKDHEIVLVESGMGKVNSAICTQQLIDLFAPEVVINTGIAGGIAPGLHVGDFVIGKSAVEHDFDLSPVGYVRGHVLGGNKKEVTYFTTRDDLIDEIRSAALDYLPAEKIHVGTIATGDQFICTHEAKKELWELFGAYAAEMEGGAIAHVCTVNDVPCILLRAISDLADEGAHESVNNFETVVADLSAKILMRFMEIVKKEN
ncbi:MAG: 5'-methylthioadenosine/adenosylhomocysteine nucleosidase [Clostridia bacterium]|nr:5'-methylthioadenosine/adenosylhomocysteine nucleosidase [Clostridia bacterium]MBQ4454178.1 5'-methylthioadenosine/adenosylhomocysteine nucleosidase [Clostridia bacterium]MBQ5956873.1 5'-methylthioadenosine/adenosylhomocysteine nucleosidase [Clostridia bacterium]